MPRKQRHLLRFRSQLQMLKGRQKIQQKQRKNHLKVVEAKLIVVVMKATTMIVMVRWKKLKRSSYKNHKKRKSITLWKLNKKSTPKSLPPRKYQNLNKK